MTLFLSYKKPSRAFAQEGVFAFFIVRYVSVSPVRLKNSAGRVQCLPRLCLRLLHLWKDRCATRYGVHMSPYCLHIYLRKPHRAQP